MAVTASAHHSFAVFDLTKQVKLVGVVKEFRWANPHCLIELSVRNEKGELEEWTVEMTSPGHLVRAGWKSTTVKPSEEVTILVNPLKSNETVGRFLSITLANGQTLTETSGTPK
jgi:hypothetical protein